MRTEMIERHIAGTIIDMVLDRVTKEHWPIRIYEKLQAGNLQKSLLYGEPYYDLEDDITSLIVEQLDTIDETGVIRTCENCDHFDGNEDEFYTIDELPLEFDGFCREGGSEDQISDKDKPLTRFDCNAFKLDSLLRDLIKDGGFTIDEKGMIQDAN